MDTIDTYVGYVGLICLLVFFIVWAVKCFSYWNQIKEGFLQSGIGWPLHSQKELDTEARKNYFIGYRMIWENTKETVWIIFSLHTDNPAIFGPLRGFRRMLITFFVFPIVLAIVLAVITFLIP